MARGERRRREGGGEARTGILTHIPRTQPRATACRPACLVNEPAKGAEEVLDGPAELFRDGRERLVFTAAFGQGGWECTAGGLTIHVMGRLLFKCLSRAHPLTAPTSK